MRSAISPKRGCLRRPWLFAELAAVFDGREPGPQPCFGEIADLMRRHAELLVDFFGPTNGIRQMRKWCAWYTTGFRNSAAVRGALVSIESIEEMIAIVGRLDPEEPFPIATLRSNRVKDGRVQRRVQLPAGYLDRRDDDTPLSPPFDPQERAAFERALDGG